MQGLIFSLPTIELHILKLEGTLIVEHHRDGDNRTRVMVTENEFRNLARDVSDSDKVFQASTFLNASTAGLEFYLSVDLSVTPGSVKVSFLHKAGGVVKWTFDGEDLDNARLVIDPATTLLDESGLNMDTNTDMKLSIVGTQPTSTNVLPGANTASNDQPGASTPSPQGSTNGETSAVIKPEPTVSPPPAEHQLDGASSAVANLDIAAPLLEEKEEEEYEDPARMFDPEAFRYLYVESVSTLHEMDADVEVEAILQIDRTTGVLKYQGFPGWSAEKIPVRPIPLCKEGKAFITKPLPRIQVTAINDQGLYYMKLNAEYLVLNAALYPSQAMWASDADKFEKPKLSDDALFFDDRDVIQKALDECMKRVREAASSE